VLETLFDIRSDVRDIHAAILGGGDDEEEGKLTPEEREARRLRDEDLTRRLEEMIERYRKLNAERRAAGAG
jgi:hypothetical protein